MISVFSDHQAIKAGGHHHLNDFFVAVKFTHFQKLHHRITRACIQSVEHRNGGQGGIDKALLLRLNYPCAEQVTHFHQPIHVGAAGHEAGAQARVVARQGWHLPGQFQLQGPACGSLEFVQGFAGQRAF